MYQYIKTLETPLKKLFAVFPTKIKDQVNNEITNVLTRLRPLQPALMVVKELKPELKSTVLEYRGKKDKLPARVVAARGAPLLPVNTQHFTTDPPPSPL